MLRPFASKIMLSPRNIVQKVGDHRAPSHRSSCVIVLPKA
jgi:hypothetical protein